jgi:hypothetical protein
MAGFNDPETRAKAKETRRLKALERKSIAAPRDEVAMIHPETGMAVPKKAAQPEEAPKTEPVRPKLGDPDPKAPPPNLFSGRVKRLEVHPLPGGDPNDPIPGYRLYWFHDVENEIAKAEASGYRFVEREEIGLNEAHVSPGNNDLGVHVRRWVNSVGGPNGGPVYAFLMKKPNWLAELHDAELEKVHQMQEAQLRAGNMNNQIPMQVRHAPSGASIASDTSLYKPR